MGHTMKTVQFMGNSRVEVREVSVPEPGPGEALVRIAASAICGSELPAVRRSEPPAPHYNTGHEMVGTVVQANRLSRIREGERVGIQVMIGCGRCYHCLLGNPKHCIQGERYLLNAHSEYIVAPEICLIPLPDELDWEAALLLCGDTLGTPYRALKRLGGVQARQTAAVFGCGPIGIGALTWLKYFGAYVIVSEPNPYRRELAARLGADLVLDPTMEDAVARIRKETGRGAELCLDCSEAPATLNAALDSACIWGRVGLVGEKSAATINPSEQAIRKELTLVASWYFTAADFLEEVAFYRRGLDLTQVITHRYRLSEAPEAYVQFMAGSTGKVIFVHE